MKTLILFFVAAIFFIACNSAQPVVFQNEKTEFHEVQIAEKKYNFSYPSSAIVDSLANQISYASCKVNFGLLENLDQFKADEINEKEEDGKIHKAFLKQDLLVGYLVLFSKENYVFWTWYEAGLNSDCQNFVEKLADSFSDELNYISEEFAFSVQLNPDYKIEYLGNGVMMQRWIELSEEEIIKHKIQDVGGYKVEIFILPSENLSEHKDLGSYIAEKYVGYTIEGAEYPGTEGIYVNEGSQYEAVRHFFAMSKDGKILYELYLKVPSAFYSKHQAEFDSIVKTLKINL